MAGSPVRPTLARPSDRATLAALCRKVWHQRGFPFADRFDAFIATQPLSTQPTQYRAYLLWDGAELRTRNGQRLDAPAELHGISERIDGEYLGGVFYAFDLVDHPGTLDERWTALQALNIQTRGVSVTTAPATSAA